MKKKNIPPSISTFIPAWCILSFVGLVLVSILFLPQRNALQEVYKELALAPWQKKLHLSIAQIFLEANNLEAATRELTQVNQTPAWFQNSVLGDTTEVADLQQAMKQTTTDLVNREAYWKSIVEKYPLYKDGWIQLLLVAKGLKKEVEYQTYLEKIIQLDPNFSIPNDATQ